MAEATEAQSAGEGAAWSLHQMLTRDEIRELRSMNDVRGWWTVVVNWGLIALSMALVAHWPNALSVLLAVCVIGGRQLGLAIMMHDASHHALLKHRRSNDWVGNWLAAYPVWADLKAYRPYHLQHHSHTWTDKDPDLALATPFPVTRASLRRKLSRDLTGQTGFKLVVFAARRDLGTEGSWPSRLWRGLRHEGFRGMLITNGLLLALLVLTGHPALYLLWLAAYFTTYTAVIRIRSIAEHSMSPDPRDPRRNTRTVLTRWWERLLIAPNHVGYHLEHHLLMTVPHYRLKRMHQLLRERGALEGALVVRGYRGILRQAASRPE